MTTVRGLAEIVLRVSDLARAVAFYRDVLGLTVISPPERANPIFLRAGAPAVRVPQMLVLVQAPAEALPLAHPGSLHHMAFEVAPEDFESEKARLERLGYAVRGGQHPVIPSRTMYIDDPDGNEVELICSA